MRLILNTIHSYLKLCFICLSTIFLVACSMPKEIKENEGIAQQVINTLGLIQNHVKVRDTLHICSIQIRSLKSFAK